jgi:protein LSM14
VSSSLAPVLSATTTLNIATTATLSCSAPVLSVPLSPATSLPSSLQGGVSAVITPAAKNPRRMLGLAYQSAQPSAQQTVENSSPQSPLMTGVPSAVASVQSHTATTQLTGVLAAPSKAHPSSSQQAPVKLEQKSDEPAKLAGQSITSTAEPPQQQQVTQPLLPLPQSQQKQPPLQVFKNLLRLIAHALYSEASRGCFFVTGLNFPSGPQDTTETNLFRGQESGSGYTLLIME